MELAHFDVDGFRCNMLFRNMNESSKLTCEPTFELVSSQATSSSNKQRSRPPCNYKKTKQKLFWSPWPQWRLMLVKEEENMVKGIPLQEFIRDVAKSLDLDRVHLYFIF